MSPEEKQAVYEALQAAAVAAQVAYDKCPRQDRAAVKAHKAVLKTADARVTFFARFGHTQHTTLFGQ